MIFSLLMSFAFANCLDASDVSAVRAKILVEPVSFDLCDETRNTHKLFSALVFLKNTPLPAVQSPISKNILPDDAWSFLTTRIQSITTEGTCAMGQMAFVLASQPGVMHLCPGFFDDAFTIVERIPTLLHEAHHFDGDHFFHAHCTQGRLKGMRNACDPSLDYGGGYAVETEVLSKLLQVPTLDKSLKTRVRLMALNRAAENFNEPVASYRFESIYLEGADGRGYLLDPEFKGIKEVPLINRSNQDIVSRGATLNIFPRDGRDAFVVNVLSADFTSLPAEGSVTNDWNKLPQAQRPRMLRIFNDDIFSGSVTEKRFSVAQAPNPYETEVDLPFTATAIFNSQELGTDDVNSLYMLDDHGGLNRIKLSPGRNHELFPPTPFATDFRAFVFFQGKRLAIDADGILVVEENGQWKPLPVAVNKRFTYASSPFYWAPFLAE